MVIQNKNDNMTDLGMVEQYYDSLNVEKEVPVAGFGQRKEQRHMIGLARTLMRFWSGLENTYETSVSGSWPITGFTAIKPHDGVF